VETPFKRRNISIRKEITTFSSKFESLSFAICGDCFDTKVGVLYVRRVQRSGNTVKTPKYLNQERNYSVFVEN
jgi:hypothetical protein